MALLLVGFAVRAVLRHTASAELPPSPSRVEVAPEDWRRPLFDLAAAADWGAAAAWIADRLPSLSPEQAGNLALLLGSWLDPQVEPTPPEEFRLSLAETWIGLGHFDERSLHQVAELLLRNGRALEALELLDSHLQQHPEQVQLAVVAVQAALAVRDAERAERWMTLVRQASPGLVPPELQAQLEQELTELRNLRTMESPYFVLALEESTSQERGRELLAQLDQAHAELAEKLGVEAMGKISVVLYSDPRFAGVGGAAQPAWVEASFDGKIRLPVESVADQARAPQVLRHEMAHALLHLRGAQGMPLWLNEGVAQLLEEREPPCWTDGQPLPSLERLSASFVSEGDPTLARNLYVASHMLAARLVERGGWESLRGYLDRLKEGGSPEEAFAASFSLSPAELWQQLAQELPELWCDPGAAANMSEERESEAAGTAGQEVSEATGNEESGEISPEQDIPAEEEGEPPSGASADEVPQ